ncbi:MAG: VTT domain-containing protein [Mariprofundaceae bacterium]|nr:VTT domain-containing protein [Mariprofundaceae bacterium]
MDWALFFAALVSATFFPGGSEALLLYKLHAGGAALTLLLTATAGNVLGSLITYTMGRFGNIALRRDVVHQWLRMSAESVVRAEAWFQRYGKAALLFAWLPVVGDPLCLVAGLLRFPLFIFLLMVTLGKLARYAFLLWVFSNV